MGQIIRLTPELRESMRTEFEKYMETARCQGGKINFSKALPDMKDRKATVYLTTLAFTKLWTLVMNFDKEVAWNGIAHRLDDEELPDSYLVTDILVYPQQVTGTTVETDQLAYQNWFLTLGMEVNNHIRFQGHSHVKMGVSPSGTDLEHQKKIISQLGDEDFYIFMIWNKNADCHTKVYDMQKNLFFDNADCTVKIMEDGFSFAEFLKQAKEMVKEQVYTTPTYAGGYRGGYYGEGSYGGNYGGNYGGSGNYGGYPSSVFKKEEPKEAKKPEPEKKEPEKKPAEKKPAELAPVKPRVPIAAGNFHLDDYDGPMEFDEFDT